MSVRRASRAASVPDADLLASLGHAQTLTRQFSPLAMLGMAFAILNSWTALSASLSLALPSGGPSAVLWGLLTAGICNLCLAASLGEFLSAYPTAAGQYHWVAVVSPAWARRGCAWFTGWINLGGWVALTATGGLLGSQLIIGVISLMLGDAYESKPWHQFLIYIGYTLFAFFVNAFANRLLPLVNQAALWWSLVGFVVICITVLACASPEYADARYVFGGFYNGTGWPDGVAWLLGLLQGGLGLTAYDAVAHMVEEIPNPTVEGPKIMVNCVAIGLGTGFVFLMVLLFVSGGAAAYDDVVGSSAGSLLEILFMATSSRAGAVCLLMFPLICLLFATTAIMTTSSRMIFAFARDRGLPFSRYLARIHPRLETPVEAITLTTFLVIVFGCVFLGSSAAFNAIISASVVALGISYAMPIAVNCLQGRSKLPERSWTLSPLLGWTMNLVGLGYTILTTVLFLFPPELPVDASSMNYCVVALGIWLSIAGIQWLVDGRKNFEGPQVEIGEEVVQIESANGEGAEAWKAKAAVA